MALKTLAAAACLSITTATAGLAAIITVNGDEFDVTTITGAFDDNQTLLESQVFFGDEDLAIDFALEVGDFFGFPNDVFNGPIFTVGVNQFGNPIGQAFSSIFDDVSLFAIQRVGVFTYAVATPVSAVPLPAGGLLLLSAFGGVAALKRRKKRAA